MLTSMSNNGVISNNTLHLNENNSSQKIRTKRTKQICELILEYFGSSTIHGLRYLGEERPIREKIFWVVVLILSLGICSFLIRNVFIKWYQDPVLVSFAEKSVPVWKVPFPTITICPETKAKQSIFNFTEMYHLISERRQFDGTKEQRYNMEAILHLCEPDVHERIQFGSDIANRSIVRTLERLALDFDETVGLCFWRNTLHRCDNIFQKVLTEEGICYQFNSIDSTETYNINKIHKDFIFKLHSVRKSDWDCDTGYSIDSGPDTVPRRGLGAGPRAGFYLIVAGHPNDFEYFCRGAVQGFKVILTTPGEIPKASKEYFRIPFGKEILVSIIPNIIITTDVLRSYATERRHCFFQGERRLNYFKVYTQENCLLECLANYTLHRCGCVKFSMPRNSKTPVCGAGKIQCYNHAEDTFLAKELKQGLRSSRQKNYEKTDCNCLQACTSITYATEISYADYDFSKSLLAYSPSKFTNHSGLQIGRFGIAFKETQFIASKRSELYGTTDLLASCGGLMGLLMGISALTFIELAYFCSFRLWTHWKSHYARKQELSVDA